jgi:high affinity Mn2+ porin
MAALTALALHPGARAARAQDSTGHASEFAASASEERWTARFQATIIWQEKPAFYAAYSGTNSLLPNAERAYSFTPTAFLGVRAWQGAEFYFNPEGIQSVPFSGLHGLGGLTDSEQQKLSSARLKFYSARLFLRQTFDLGGGRKAVESAPDQMAGTVDTHRLVITVGQMSILDVFDNNAYAHDPRTQFPNWVFLTYGAFDYAADARGYSEGLAAEYFHDDWAARIGRFMGPLESNGLPLDRDIARHHGDQAELEHAHVIGDQPGKLRVLAFRNAEVMGSFADAIAFGAEHGGVPDVANVRRLNQKIGLGMSAEQQLRPDIGTFARASWADGKTETYSFTEVENSLSAGVVARGDRWDRTEDHAGLAFAQDGLSGIHQEYLSLGGLGAFIGDGHLTYGPERVVEAYYELSLVRKTAFMVGYQHIVNPAYNVVRGPVNVGTVRLHTEF